MADSKVASTETRSDSINKIDLCSKQEAETLRPETSNDGSATLQETTKPNTNQAAKSTLSLDTPAADMSIKASLKSLVDGSITACNVVQTTPSTYEVSYTPQIRGRHQLSVSVNNHEITRKEIFVHHPPTQLGTPIRVIDKVFMPWDVSMSPDGDVYVVDSTKILKLDKDGQPVLFISARASLFEKCNVIGVTVSKDGSIYIAGGRKLFKLDKEGKLVKSVGGKEAGSNPGEFRDAYCVKVHTDKLYVCDWENHRVQVLDLDLNFVTMFGTEGDHKLKSPIDIDFDSQGNMYVTDYTKDQVAVFDCDHQFVRAFGSKDSGKLNNPWGICVVGEYVYVTEYCGNCVSVFLLSGQFVCSFGHDGGEVGQLSSPYGVMVDKNGFCYVCDYGNNRVKVF